MVCFNQRVKIHSPMKLITLKVTAEELKLLTSLASDQLFRKEFIDPKIPGYRYDPAELSLGKALVGRMRLMTDTAHKGTDAV